MAIKDRLGFEFDPNEKYPIYQGYSPEEAGMVGKELSDRGINPIFTDSPTQTADSGQIYTDLKPPTSYAPSDEAMKFAQEQVKFAKYFDEELDKSGNFGSSMYRTPLQEEMKKKIFNEGMKNFSEWYQSQRQEKTYSQGAVTTSGLSVSFNKGSGQWEVSNPDGTKEPWNQNLHGKIQNAMSTTTLPDKSFNDWDKEDKDKAIKDYILTGKPYRFSNRDAASTQQYAEYAQKFLSEHGLTPEDVNNIRQEVSANSKSLSTQQKNRDMASSFVKNINGQLQEIEKLYDDIERTNAKIANVPIRALATQVKGSGKEQALASYLMEVSREIGKLSTGSQASIAELSVDAQKKWDKVHDGSLPWREIKEVLKATKDQSEIRLQSMDKAISELQQRNDTVIDRYSKIKTPEQPVVQNTNRDISKPIIYLKSASSRDDAISKIRELSKKGWTREELVKIVKEAGWE